MKLPGNISAAHLIRALQKLGYEVIRQKGSHIRLRHPSPPQHSISFRTTTPLKKGTLHGIVAVDTIFDSL